MTLAQLLASIEMDLSQAGVVQLTGLTLDSRAVVEGDVFVAMAGTQSHGMLFADQAVRQGAVAILFDAWDGAIPAGIPVIQVSDLRRRLGLLAHAFFQNPAQGQQVIGVTGTNGKTTIVHLLSQLASAQGLRVGRMGTLGIFVGQDQLADGDRTTPDAIHVAKYFADFRDRGVQLCAMEVSSHALDQYRVAGVPFDIGVFTNLTRDHLDYHGTMEAYGAAKQRLFTEYGLRSAVIDRDDPFGDHLVSTLSDIDIWSFGLHPDARVRIESLKATDQGSQMVVVIAGSQFVLNVPLLGYFNARNALAALVALHVAGQLHWDDAPDLLATLKPAPGRMEAFRADGRPTVVVDYAHTPDALKNALQTARWHTEGDLWVVFGCGGDRDQGKRALMGEVAADLADHVVLTSDNPRSESAQVIAEDIAVGAKHSAKIQVQLDRAKAIQQAFDAASEADLILVAGKGHEHTQTVGDRVLPYSDRATVAQLFGLLNSGVAHAS